MKFSSIYKEWNILIFNWCEISNQTKVCIDMNRKEKNVNAPFEDKSKRKRESSSEDETVGSENLDAHSIFGGELYKDTCCSISKLHQHHQKAGLPLFHYFPSTTHLYSCLSLLIWFQGKHKYIHIYCMHTCSNPTCP